MSLLEKPCDQDEEYLRDRQYHCLVATAFQELDSAITTARRAQRL
jgi:hypothetical protein